MLTNRRNSSIARGVCWILRWTLAGCPVMVAMTSSEVSAAITEAQRGKLQQSGKIASAVVDTLARADEASVIVGFDVDQATLEARIGRFDDETRHAWNSAIRSVVDRILGRLPPAGVVIRARFESARAFSATLSVEGAVRLAGDPEVYRIDEERPMRAGLTQALPFVGVDRTQALGFTGSGVTVAILDSGFERTHPDLSDDLIEEQCFCTQFAQGCCPNGTSRQFGPGSAPEEPGYAHGTFMAGIVTGRGSVAPRGVAPDSDIIGVKVLGENGVGTDTGIIAALDWVLNNRPNVDVLNMSFGYLIELENAACDGYDAATQAKADIIDALRLRGTTVVASSGNDHAVGLMQDPACIQSVISVASSYDDDPANESYPGCPGDTHQPDDVACFGNANQTTDMVAPGVNITSVYIGGGVGIASGTSESAALLSGCAALLTEAAPQATSREIEEALESVPEVVDRRTIGHYGPDGLNFPRLACMASLDQILGGSGLCPASARTGCRLPTVRGAGSFYLKKYVATNLKDYWRWYWKRGQATSGADFGDPSSMTSFSACVYDQGGSRLLMNMFIPGGGVCAGKPCWRSSLSGGWKYKDKLRSPSGVEALTLTPGSAGAAAITMKGQGPNLRASLPPLIPPVRAQLLNHQNGACWEATFSSPLTNGGSSSFVKYYKDHND